ncbi:hypothetical protein LguiA_027233 [Lonicera macranthoides]
MGNRNKTKRSRGIMLPYMPEEILTEVEVYSMSTDCWKKVGVNSAPLCFLYDTVQFLNVTAYWLARKERKVGSVDLMVAFDMLNGVFEEIMLPDIDCKREECVSMAAFGGSLYYSHCNGVAHDNYDCDIWVLRFSKNIFSWTKQYTISLPNIRGPPLGFRKNGEVVLSTDTGGHVSYNIEVKRAEEFKVAWFPKFSHVDSFFESLVLLSDVNGVLGPKISSDEKKMRSIKLFSQ